MNAVDFAFFLIEIVGTVAFAISGAMIAIERNLDLFGVLFLGVTTAIGGGIMRDILLGHIPPRAFSNYIYLTVAAGTALVVFLVTAWNRKDGGHRHRFIRTNPHHIFGHDFPQFHCNRLLRKGFPEAARNIHGRNVLLLPFHPSVYPECVPGHGPGLGG